MLAILTVFAVIVIIYNICKKVFTKKMNEESDLLAAEELPRFPDETKALLQWMQGLSYKELKELWKCNDRLAELNFDRVRRMDLKHNLTLAIISYEGIQYRTQAKMARGEMVRYMAEHGIRGPEEVKEFDRLGYRFRPELSSDNEYVFLI